MFIILIINSSCNRNIVLCLNKFIPVDTVCEYFCDKALIVHKKAILADGEVTREKQKQEYMSAVTAAGNVVTEVA